MSYRKGRGGAHWLGMLVGVLTLLGWGAVQGEAAPPRTLSETLAAHVYALSVQIGTRPAGSAAEAQAAQYIAAQLRGWGYAVEIQPFTFTRDGQTYISRNVIARKAANVPAGNEGTLIVGAHMDCVTAGTGADDNASGVAVMLATAEALADVPSAYTWVFVAFGSEEVGELGSQHYVETLDETERARMVAMFNVDTVGVGDFAYVYAGARTEHEDFRQPYTPGPTWVRDLALRQAEQLGISMRTSPAEGWAGFTGPWSDHQPFVNAGVPVAYFERWNWDAGSNPGWGVERAEGGDVLHTARDCYEAVDAEKMASVARVLMATLEALARGAVTPPAAQRLRLFEISNFTCWRLSGFHRTIYNKTMRLL